MQTNPRTELTFAQRMDQVMRRSRVAQVEDAAPQRDRLGEQNPNTYPLPILNSKGA